MPFQQKVKQVFACRAIRAVVLSAIISLCFTQTNTLIAQCDPGVPAFVADLRGNADSVWTSPSTSRSDNCCGTSNPDRCIKFTVYLDAGSQGIRFELISGAIPSGSLFYQIGCGTSYAVGDDICLSGSGPHELTFCKPGNNQNVYSITAIPAPAISPNITVSMACVDTISVSGLVTDSITWTAYPANSTYDNYLSCRTGCDTTIVTPTGVFPDSVMYVACGPIEGGCAGSTFCDTVTVYFVTDLAVQIQPDNPTLCFGDTATTITAHATGGLAPYRFYWSHIGGSGQGDSVQYVDTGTYIVSLLDSLGCSFAYDTVIVTGYSDSILAFANDTDVCRRAGAIQLNGSVQQATGGRWIGGTGTFSPSDSILNPTYTLSGTELNAGYTQVRLITTGNGTCPADTQTITITVRETPSGSLSTPLDTVCQYDFAEYTADPTVGDSISWTIYGGTITTTNNYNRITVQWDTTGVGIVQMYRSSILYGCDTTVYDTIVVLPSPTPVIAGPDSACEFETVTYTLTANATQTFTWSVNGGSIVSGQSTNSVDVFWNSYGTGVVSVTVANSNGCDSTVSDTILIVQKPTPSISGFDSACHNNIYTYTVSNVAGNTYSWSTTNGTLLSGQGTNSVTILWGTIGTGIVNLTQTSAFGCDSAVSDTIVILYTPAPVITGDDSVCSNKITTYSVPAVAGDTYSWVVGNGTITTGQGTNSIDVLWGSVGTGTVSITQTSPSGCDSTVTDSITIFYTPAPVITGADSICENNTATYTVSAVGGDTYVWQVSNGTILGGQSTNSVDILWGTAGAGSVTITQTSPFGCDSTVVKNVTVIYTPKPVITGSDTACQNKQYTFSVPAVGGDTYAWQVSNGTITTGQGTNSIIAVFDTIGIGTVRVTQTSALGCDSTITDTIVTVYTPAPVITGTDSSCHNKIYTFSVPSVAGDTYTWVATNGSIIDGQGTNSITVAFDTVGTGTVSITQTSPFGCDSTLSTTVTILYTPAPVISGEDSACHNKIYTYTTPSVAGDSYTWNVNNGTILSGQGTNSIDILWGTAGVGTVQITQTSPFRCDSTVLDSIVILYTPVPIISGEDSACHNNIYTYTTPNVAGDSYTWIVNNGTILTGQGTNSVDILWGTAGVGTVQVSQSSPLGCDSTVLDSIVILYTPVPLISGEDSTCHNNIYTYTTPSIAGDSYTWSVNNGTILTGQGTNSVDILWGTAGVGTVQVTQTSPLGCDSTVLDSIVILYTPAPVISGEDSACHNNVYTYTTPNVAGDSYLWSINNGTLLSGQGTNSVDILWGTAGVGVIRLAQSSPLGCDSSVRDSIVILYTPAPVITGEDSACHNNIYTYTTPSNAGDSYTWTVSNGTILTGQGTNSIDILWGTAGVGTVQVTQTSPLGCDSTVLDSIVILYTPVPVITGEDSACHNNIYTYTTASVAGDSYAWVVNNGSIVTGQGTNSVDILWGSAGVGTVQVTQTSPLSCDSTVVDSIVILYTPVPVITGEDSACHNNIYTYTTPSVAGDSYTWTVLNGTILAGQGTNSVDILWGTAGVGTVQVTQTSPLSCDSTVLDSIVILYTPVPVITGEDSTCHNNIYTYTTSSVAGDSYTWSVNNGTIVTGQGTNSIDILWGTAGVGTVQVTQTSPLGCDSTVLDSIVILYTPAPIINGEDSACHNNIYTYTTPSVAGDSYNWTVSNGTILAGQSTNSIDILWGTAGVGTVQVTQTSPLSCDSTVLDSIVILYTPTPVISGEDSACHNNIYTYTTPSVVGDSYVWAVSNGTILAGQGTNSINILWGTAGVGTVQVTQTSPLSCDSTVSDSIIILYTPVPVISGEDSACHNNIYTYTTPSVVGDSYTWVVNNGTIVTGQGTNSVDILWGTAGVGTVQVTQTSSLGCDSTVSDSIVILYTPAPVITGADSTCQNKIYTYTTPSVAGDSYNWTITNGTIISGQGTNSIDVMQDTIGTSIVSITQTSPLGCDSTVSDTIVVVYTPAPVLSGADTVCHNNIYTYSVPNIVGDTYSWSVSNGTILTGQSTNSIDVLWGTAGSGTVSVTQNSPFGCDSTLSATITILYTPAPVITGADSTCQNKIYTYTTPSVAGDTYSWTVTNGTILAGQGTNSIDVMLDTIGTSVVSITQTSPLGCDSTVSDTIVVVYTPAPVLSGADTVCHNKIYTYNVPNIGGDTYSWSVTNGTILTGQSTNSIDVLWGTAGSGNVTLTQTSPFGCDSTLSASITILYTPVPVISGEDSACHNNIYTYSTPSVAGDSYTWVVSNGTIISGQGTNSVDVLWGTAGAASISVTQTSPLSCDSTVNFPVLILYTPAPVISGADSACQNKIYTYTTPSVAGDSYNWTISNGTIIAGQGTNSIGVMLDTIGTSVVLVTQTSPLGCDSTITDTIRVIYTPAPVLSGADTVCHNNIYTYSVPNIVGDTFSWSVTNGTILTGQGTNSVDVLWGTAGSGTVSVTQTSPFGCDSTLSATITILYTPAPVISGEDSTCHNNIYTYTTPSVAGDSYNWTVNNGSIITGQGTNSVDILWGTAGVGTVQVTQTSPLGCDSTVVDSIVILYTPAPVINGADSACQNKIYTYTTASVAGDSYNWTVTNGTILTGQGTNSIDVMLDTIGTSVVSITQTSPLGCDSTITDTIRVIYTPAPVLSGADTVCHNNIYTYSVPNIVGDTFSWSVSNGTILAGQGTNSVDVLWGTAGSGTVSVTQTSPYGCDSTLGATITILYTPAPIINGADSTCQNKIYTYTTASVAGDSYTWTVSNGTIISGQGTNSIDVMLDTVGSSVVLVTQTSPLGCDSTVTDTINVIYTPAPVLSGADTVCHNNIYTYSVPNIVGDTFSWTVSNGTILTGQGTNSVDVLWGTAGSGTVSVTQTSPYGCDSTLSATITILYTPVPIINGVDSACQNKIYTYSTPNIGGDSYNWVVTNGTIIAGQGTNSIDVMLDTVGSSVVLVTQTSPLGCDSTVTDTINVIYTPAPVLSGADTVCHNNIYTYSVPNIVGDTFSWSITNGTILTGQGTNSVDVLWGTAGSGTVSVTQTSPYGCDSTLSATITILYTPAPVITGADSACQNKIYTYSTPSVAGDSYTWTVTNGTILTGQGTNSIDVMLDTVGNSVITITQTSPLGCDSTVTDTIKVLYTPSPTILGPDTSCHNKIQTYSVPLVPTDTYSWAVSNGTIISGQGTNTVDVLWGTAGVTGSILATQTSPSGCDSTVGYTVVVILYTPAPVITGTDSACYNKPYNYSVPSVAGDLYSWTITNGTILSGQNTNAISVLWDTVGTGTISITQTSPLSCDSTITRTINVLYTPAPVVLGNDTVCHNKIYTYSVPSIAGDTYSWSVTNGTILAGQSTNSIDVLWGTAGSGSVSITQTSTFGCDSSITADITILYTPAPIITGDDSVCHNNIYTYSVPNIVGDTFSWSVSNGTIIAGQGTNSVDILWGTAGAASVSVTQTSPLSCDSTITLPVLILYTPAPIITGADSACQNKIYTYTTSSVAGDSYNWIVTNGTIISGQGTNSIDVMLDTVGISVIHVTQTSPLGCDSTITDTINVIYTPSPVLSGADTVCHNNIYSYSVDSISGDAYSWSVTNGTILTGQGTSSVDILWGTAGSGTISVTQTSPFGCDSTLSATITILYTPAPIITGADSACQNKIYTYSVPNIGGDNYTWTVSNGTIIAGQGTNSIDVMLDTIGNSVIIITQTSPLGCDSTVTDTIKVIYTPVPVITGPDTTCHNKIQSYSVPNVAGDSYTWTVSNGTIITGQNTSSIDVLWGTTGTGSLSITQTSASGCDSTVGYSEVVIQYTPAPVIAGTGNACHNKPYNYSVTSIAGDTYTWTVTNGSIVAGQGTNVITILWDTVGTGVVAITQTSPAGCDSTINRTINVIYTPVPVILGADTVCHNKIYTYSVPAVAGDFYDWTVTNGTILTGQSSNSIDVLWGTAGSGTITITQTSLAGCDSTISANITILYTPAPIITGDDSVCYNNIYTYSVPNIVGDTFSWNVTNGTILAGQGTNSIDVIWSTVGAGSVSITQTSPLGCDSVITLPVRILYTPAPIITGADSACQNKIYTYSTPNVGGDSYNWVVTNGTIIAGQGTNSIDVMLDTVGTSVILVTQTSALGCDSTVTDTIDVLYTPAPVLTGADTVCHNNIYTYSVDSIVGDTFSWTVTNGTILTGQGTSSVDVLWGAAGSGTISVTQTSPLGCDSTLSANITILYTPAPIITGADSACQNKIYTYSVPNIGGDNYTWTVSNGTIIAGQGTNSIDVMLDTIGSSVVIITQTSPLGCDSTVTDTIKVIYTPAPVITGPDTTCHNKIQSYSVDSIAGDSYTWNVTNGTIISGQNTHSIDVLWGTTGTGSLSITQTSASGCDSTVGYNVVVIQYTPAPVIAGNGDACHNKTYNYSVISIAGDTYNWTVTNGSIIAGQGTNVITILWDTVGTGVVAITQTSPAGCDSTISRTINVIYTPVPVILGADTVCHNKIYTYSVTAVAGDFYDWTVTNGTILTGQSSNSIDVLWGTAGSGTITITQTSLAGCDSTTSANITILYSPAPIIAGADSSCFNSIHTYSVQSIVGDTFSWSVTNGTILGGQGTDSVEVLWTTQGAGSISVTQTSIYGCDSTVSKPVQVLYAPTPVVLGLDTVCHNKIYSYNVTNVSGDTYNWVVSNGVIVTGQGTNAVDIMWGAPGIGTLSVTQTSSLGCDSTVSDTAVILYSPNPQIQGNDTVCFEQIHTYSVDSIGLDTYQWAVSNGTILSGQGTDTITVQWNTVGNGFVRITQTSPQGCDSVMTLPVNIRYRPTPKLSGTTLVCSNKIITYSTPASVGDSYVWTAINGTIINGQGTNTVDVMWNLTDTGYIYVDQISALGCDSVVFDTITIRPTPAPILLGDDTVCHNKIGFYSVDSLPSHTYQWTINGGTLLSGQATSQISVIWGAAGTGRVTVTQTSGLGCDSSMFADIVIQPSPTPVISSPDTVCNNKIYQHSVATVAGNTYLWQVVNGAIVSDSTTNTVSILWGVAGKGYVSIIQTSALGCDSLMRDSVVIVGSPNPQIAGPDTVCHNKVGTYTVSPAPVNNTYQWSVTNGTILSGQGTSSISVLWGAAGVPASVSVLQTDIYGCDSLKTYDVFIQPSPNPVIQGSVNICSENFEYYTVTAQAGHTYKWSVIGGALMSPVDSVAARINWGAPGLGSVTIVQTNQYGCDSAFALPVTIRQGPVRLVVGPDTACVDNQYIYTANNAQGGDTYLWTVTGGTIQGANNAAQVNVVWNSIGLKRLRLDVTNSFGCDSTFSIDVDVFDLPTPDMRGSDKACANSKNNLFKDYKYNSTQSARYRYAWSLSGGGVITTPTDVDSILVDWLAVGTHTVNLAITDIVSGCVASQTFTVLVDSLHQPQIVASGLSGCAPMRVVFTEVENSDNLSYQWLIDGLGYRAEKSPQITYTSQGTYNARVIVTNAVGCVDTAFLQVIVRPSPVADFSINKNGVLVYEEDTAFFTNLSTGAVKYSWIFHDSTTDSSFNSTKYYDWPGKYPVRLVAINEYGCPDTTEKDVIINVKPLIFVPNSFSPNGDYNNDVWEVSTYFISEMKVIIFDRWGEIVFRSEDVNFKWDGIYKGYPVQQDVFGYQIIARGFNHELIVKTGNITVLR